MLEPCKECGADVSTKASSCPHCGANQPTGGLHPAVKWGISVAVAALVAWGAMAAYLGSPSPCAALESQLNEMVMSDDGVEDLGGALVTISDRVDRMSQKECWDAYHAFGAIDP